ncbi:MAG: c-type cytochrome [Sulfurimicrobium sp.]
MSKHHEEKTKTTPMQVVFASIGGLIPPLITIFLVVQLVLSIQHSHVNKDTDEILAKTVAERIKPVGEEKVADANAPKVVKSGEEVFNAVCTACHTSGALNAPKFGNKGDWAPRIAQGYDTLVKHAIEGIRAMPARGGAADLSDQEMQRAVAYMADAGGAKFTAPK